MDSSKKITFTLKVRDFRKAREYARNLGLSTKTEWDDWCKTHMSTKPRDIPVLPNVAYKDCGWVNYKDWLIG